MTAIAPAHAGKPDLKHFDRWFGPTIRLRTEGTDHLMASGRGDRRAARHRARATPTGTASREGGWVKTEEDPLDTLEGTSAQPAMEALRHLEEAVLASGGAVLRYGGLYGPGAPTIRSS
jgi:hypothetical protein